MEKQQWSLNGYTDKTTTTKDANHLRTCASADVVVHFTGGIIVQSKKDEFLNIKTFTHYYLNDRLERARCSTDHANMAICYARIKDTVLGGDATDLRDDTDAFVKRF